MARHTFQAVGEAQIEFSDLSARDLFDLGLKFCLGGDVDHDLVEAHKWFNIAALRGNQDARAYRAEISEEMTKQEIFTAQRAAREWLKLH